MNKSEIGPSQIDPSRIQFAAQGGVDKFEALAREFLPVIHGYDFDDVIITDESSRSDGVEEGDASGAGYSSRP